MSEHQNQPLPTSSSVPSRLLGGERRAIRFCVTGAKTVEFYGLDKARLHAWALALEGHSAQISKVVYDTIPSPPARISSTVIEEWDERSAFILLNADLKRQ